MSVELAPRPAEAEQPPLESVRDDVLLMAQDLALASRRLKAAVAEKERLARLLDTVLESIEAGVVLVGPDGQVMAANAAARRLGAASSHGNTMRLAPQLAELEAEHVLLHPEGDGGPVWDLRLSRVSLSPLGEGRLYLIQDVSRLVRLEESARRRSSLEALGRMAAELAHEVRNPLGSLEIFASMLVEDLEERPESRELAEQVLLGVRQLAGTVTRLLSTVRGARQTPERLDVAAIGREVVDFVRPVASARGVALAGPLPEQRLGLDVDPEGLRQSLLNLLGNALDVSPEGGEVSLTILRRADEVVFEVADSGPGIVPAERARIFEAFYTTRAEGTGLGLAVVERFAASHEGRVAVGDAPGGGALLTIALPAEERDTLGVRQP